MQSKLLFIDGQFAAPEFPTYRVPVRVVACDVEPGIWLATVPRLPGCVSDGRTVEEALANITEALTGVLLVHQDHGEVIPWLADPESVATHVVTVVVRGD